MRLELVVVVRESVLDVETGGEGVVLNNDIPRPCLREASAEQAEPDRVVGVGDHDSGSPEQRALATVVLFRKDHRQGVCRKTDNSPECPGVTASAAATRT